MVAISTPWRTRHFIPHRDTILKDTSKRYQWTLSLGLYKVITITDDYKLNDL